VLPTAKCLQVSSQENICSNIIVIFLSKLRWPINYIYFWYSLLYLIGRTAFVFLTAADINEESKRGLGVLRRVSSRSWCVEVERLIFQMTTQTVALSGKKFYFLTRRLLFGVSNPKCRTNASLCSHLCVSSTPLDGWNHSHLRTGPFAIR